MAKTLKLVHSVKSLREHIFEILGDFRKFASYHPYIYEISDPELSSQDSAVFRVKEKIRLLGIIPFTSAYPVRVSIFPAENRVMYESTFLKRLSITIEFLLVQIPGTERVTIEETIILNAPPLFSLPVFSIIKSAHNTLFLEMSASLKSDFYGINKLK